MSQHVADLIAAIDRKDADGIREAYAPDARLVAMTPNTFQVARRAPTTSPPSSRSGSRAGRRSRRYSFLGTIRDGDRAVVEFERTSTFEGAPVGGAPGPRPAASGAEGIEEHRMYCCGPREGAARAGRRVRGGGVDERRAAGRRAGRRPDPPPRRPARHDGAGPARRRRGQGRAARRRPVAPRRRRRTARAACSTRSTATSAGIVLDLKTAEGRDALCAPRRRRRRARAQLRAGRRRAARRRAPRSCAPATRAWSTARCRPSAPAGGAAPTSRCSAESGLVAGQRRPRRSPCRCTTRSPPSSWSPASSPRCSSASAAGRGQVVETSLLEASARPRRPPPHPRRLGRAALQPLRRRPLPPLPDRRRRHRRWPATPRGCTSGSLRGPGPGAPSRRPPLRRPARPRAATPTRWPSCRRRGWPTQTDRHTGASASRERRPAARRRQLRAPFSLLDHPRGARPSAWWWRSTTPRSGPSSSPARRCASRARRRAPARPAPRLGEHTDEVLAELAPSGGPAMSAHRAGRRRPGDAGRPRRRGDAWPRPAT